MGAGGIGKTGLAVAIAHYVRMRHHFKDGVHLVDARGLTSTLQLVCKIASALLLPLDTEAHARNELLGALATRNQLLVIDRRARPPHLPRRARRPARLPPRAPPPACRGERATVAAAAQVRPAVINL